MQIDWTLSLSNVLTYIGAVVGLIWWAGRRLNKFEETLASHATALAHMASSNDERDEKLEKAMDRIGNLAADLQRLVGRTEVFFLAPERRQSPRE